MSEHVTIELLRGFLEAFNLHDLDSIMGYFADDCVFYMPRGAKRLVAIDMLGRRKFGKGQQNDLKGYQMCIMEMISTGSVVISESLNGHLPAQLHQGNTSKFEELTCLSLLRERSSARILSGKYLSEQQGRQKKKARLRDLKPIRVASPAKDAYIA
jgi:hypothetical protein